MKQANIMAAVLVATLITTCVLSAGCIDAPKGGYGQYVISDRDMRESDGLVMNTELNYFGDNNWMVGMYTTYPAYDDMLDDERHGIYGRVFCYPSTRNAFNKMNKEKITLTKGGCEVVNLTYCDDSYKRIWNVDGESYVGIHIHHEQIVAGFTVSGYADRAKCEEVADYYAALLAGKLDNAMELE